MSLIGLIVAILILGVVMYFVNMIPMQQQIKLILNIVVIACLILFVLQAFGLLTGLNSITVPQVR